MDDNFIVNRNEYKLLYRLFLLNQQKLDYKNKGISFEFMQVDIENRINNITLELINLYKKQ